MKILLRADQMAPQSHQPFSCLSLLSTLPCFPVPLLGTSRSFSFGSWIPSAVDCARILHLESTDRLHFSRQNSLCCPFNSPHPSYIDSYIAWVTQAMHATTFIPKRPRRMSSLVASPVPTVSVKSGPHLHPLLLQTLLAKTLLPTRKPLSMPN